MGLQSRLAKTLWPEHIAFRRKLELKPYLRDYILQPTFKASVFLLSFTVIRIWLALVLLPLYCSAQALFALPHIISWLSFLLTSSGRMKLRARCYGYRRGETDLAAEQYQGTFHFAPQRVEYSSSGATTWDVPRVEVEVCGIKARVAHFKPTGVQNNGKTIVLLHGNPSWSYMWRNIAPSLSIAGYEVLCVDWLGHGASDKPTSPSEITFELHMCTLINVVEQFDLHDFYVGAHDWGGCVALCTLPAITEQRKCSGLFLLNTFFPARPSDVSLHYLLLYWIWFFSTGIMGTLLPESLVLRFMAPDITGKIANAYDSAYEYHSLRAKASIGRFSHMVPAMPDLIYQLRDSSWWMVLEGLHPQLLTNINAQARLAKLNSEVRKWWDGSDRTARTPPTSSDSNTSNESRSLTKTESIPKRVMILFGRDDPLLPEFCQVLTQTIKIGRPAHSPIAGWLSGAGHYPMEQRPESIVKSMDALMSA